MPPDCPTVRTNSTIWHSDILRNEEPMMTTALTVLMIVLPVLGVIPVHMMNTLPAPEEMYDMR